ncbi:tRNA lysidine(34) synthetase TilS [Lysobacter sp. K5869]|uniref:tRNA lysidine(34) synthetase TilS n=1 Tax=Lysobacter sp. K5869 TaxID=2820808 RepID=UPI001C063030|nr:tRNA lysidine(34) synthetase TilS [Lysobacter sp. K5869]QWP74639.1 tRNA lysidine(34) synthetase TilS [Lysobacter sp. K5869]
MHVSHADAIPAALAALPAAPLCVGYSGGLDSSVLLHALAAAPAARARGLRAWHVHHGLHADADAWAAHCARICAGYGLELSVSRVSVARGGGDGPEAAARAARHAAFAADLGAGEVLALAHHRDDQAETLLLRLLRGSGPDGLAAMREWRDCGRGRLWRPLLALPRAALEAYAQRHGLEWIDDPSNEEERYDRNFLRHRALPLLRERWPQADATLAQSARLQDEAASLLEADDAAALAQVRSLDPHALAREGLRALAPARRARVLRRWIAALELPPLPAQGVAQIERELLPARADAEAEFAWNGAAVRAWRDLLYAQWQRAPLPREWRVEWDGRAPLALPGGGRLRLDGAAAFDAPLIACARAGGERIALPGRAHRHSLKHALQALGVPPWERERLPLLLDDDGDVWAAGDLLYSARLEAWLRERGARLEWVA